MNGTEELTDDDHGLIRFWSLDELKTVREEMRRVPGQWHEDVGNAIVFADHLHWSWAYAGVVADEGGEFHVFIIDGLGGKIQIATTFSGFVELVLANDPKLFEVAG